MPNFPLPTPLQELGARRFSFYPPILNLDHNEWQYRRATWSEVVVVNTSSGEEAVIPRACVGEISIIDHPVVIVGLRRELEWREGAVYPHRRPVIEFPQAIAVNDAVHAAPRPSRAAPVVSIRLEPRSATRTGTKVAVAVMLGAVACLIAADIAREAQTRQRAEAVRRSAVRLSSADTWSSVRLKLGPPAMERARGEFRRLYYPSSRLTIVLRDSRYIGATDSSGRVLDAVTLPGDSSSGPVLRSLPPF